MAEIVLQSEELQGHEAPVVAAAFSPGGQNAATADRAGVVRIWAPACLGGDDARAAVLLTGAPVTCLAWDARADKVMCASRAASPPSPHLAPGIEPCLQQHGRTLQCASTASLSFWVSSFPLKSPYNNPLQQRVMLDALLQAGGHGGEGDAGLACGHQAHGGAHAPGAPVPGCLGRGLQPHRAHHRLRLLGAYLSQYAPARLGRLLCIAIVQEHPYRVLVLRGMSGRATTWRTSSSGRLQK